MKIIHLSDLHIGKSDNTQSTAVIFHWIVDNHSLHGSRVVVITGDIVQDGRLVQYRKAQELLAVLREAGFHVFAAPGNHDYGWTGICENWQSYDYFRSFICGEYYPLMHQVDSCVVIMLDSMRQEMIDREVWGAQGELGQAQLHDLNEMLNMCEQEHPELKVVVGLHHHPFWYNNELKLRDDDQLKDVIMDRDGNDSRIDALLFGHRHVEKRYSENPDKETKYNIGVIYSSGQTVERKGDGSFQLPVIDLETNKIEKYSIM